MFFKAFVYIQQIKYDKLVLGGKKSTKVLTYV